jgi:3-isopropylmalate dehydrogenase
MTFPAQNSFEVVVLPGEGIGPETISQAVFILRRVAELAHLNVRIREFEAGWPAFHKTGQFLPNDVLSLLDQLSASPRAAILFGAVEDEPIGTLRKRYDLFANLRPIQPLRPLLEISPLKTERLTDVDMLLIRELVSGIYYGDAREGETNSQRWAAQEMWYGEQEVRRILRLALQLAAERRKKLTLVHKANVIKGVFGLWLDILKQEAAAFPAVQVEDLLVDNMAMQMMLRPATFDVIVTSNLFGDILSEVGAGVVGSLGLMPSASLNESGFGLYEPVGGTAPAIAGKNIANPIAAILSVAMMCRHTFKSPMWSDLLVEATETVVKRYRTPDIAQAGCTAVSTSEMGERIADELARCLASSAAVLKERYE